MSCRKIFLLFGSTGDVGKAAVKFFLNQNYDQYYFFTRSSFEIQTVKNNYSIIPITDLTKEEYVTEAFAKVKTKNDACYYLFSTVGGFIGGETISTTEYADFKKMLDINLCSSFLIAKHFAKLIEETEGGSICFYQKNEITSSRSIGTRDDKRTLETALHGGGRLNSVKERIKNCTQR